MPDRIRSPFLSVADRLMDEPTLIEKRMFGSDALYLHGRLKLVLTAGGDEPWNGVLVPTFKEFQNSLITDFPELVPHSVLGKWLYLAEDCENFEKTADGIVTLILKDDKRVGVEPPLEKISTGKKGKRSTRPG